MTPSPEELDGFRKSLIRDLEAQGATEIKVEPNPSEPESYSVSYTFKVPDVGTISRLFAEYSVNTDEFGN